MLAHDGGVSLRSRGVMLRMKGEFRFAQGAYDLIFEF